MSTGVDVSSVQGQSTWPSVRDAGIKFAYVKASEGVGWVSPTLDGQFRGATGAGLVTGLYHFARPANPAEADADTFAVQVGKYGATTPRHLPPCLDLEVGTGDLSGWAARFLARLRSRAGATTVMVYSSASFFRDHIGEHGIDPGTLLWIALRRAARPPCVPHTTGGPAPVRRRRQHRRARDLNLALRPLGDITGHPPSSAASTEPAQP